MANETPLFYQRTKNIYEFWIAAIPRNEGAQNAKIGVATERRAFDKILQIHAQPTWQI